MTVEAPGCAHCRSCADPKCPAKVARNAALEEAAKVAHPEYLDETLLMGPACAAVVKSVETKILAIEIEDEITKLNFE